MTKKFRYNVAGHMFDVILPEGFSEDGYLAPYIPFACSNEGEPLFSLKVSLSDDLALQKRGFVRNCLNDEPPYFWIFDQDGYFSFAFSYFKSRPDCLLFPSEDYADNTLFVPSADADKLMSFAISNALMLLYAFKTNPFDTLLVHASVVGYDGGAYMFLGRSGTGKSTHSRLWLENIEGTYLLNDDNPVIRFIDGEVIAYGTPWSGKTPCYRNESLPLKAVVRLSQAPANKIERLMPLQAYASLLPACSCMRWDRKSTDRLHSTVEKVIGEVACWHLECLPDSDAAFTCRNAVKRM